MVLSPLSPPPYMRGWSLNPGDDFAHVVSPLFAGVAAAFGDETQMRPEIQKFVTEYFKTDDTSQPCFKLAQVGTAVFFR